MTLQLHDTMSRELVAVEPIEPGHVRMYTCGPTVWNRVHIGNFRTFIFEDVLRRWLDRRFDRVTHVMNLTDVDDRIIKNAVDHGNTLDAETAQWIAAFEEDRDTLGIRPAHHYPRATAYIDEMVDLVERLERDRRRVSDRRQLLLSHRRVPGVRDGSAARARRVSSPARAAGSTRTTTRRKTCATSRSGRPWARTRSAGTRASGAGVPDGTSSARR